jgi:hypothetical protein
MHVDACGYMCVRVEDVDVDVCEYIYMCVCMDTYASMYVHVYARGWMGKDGWLLCG